MKLFISINVPQADSDLMKAIPRAEWDKVLSIYLSRGEGTPIHSSWGTPKFDQSMKFMSIQLDDGKMLVFNRFRTVPDPDADESHFDRKPYFNLTINSGAKLSCSQVQNLR